MTCINSNGKFLSWEDRLDDAHPNTRETARRCFSIQGLVWLLILPAIFDIFVEHEFNSDKRLTWLIIHAIRQSCNAT